MMKNVRRLQVGFVSGMIGLLIGGCGWESGDSWDDSGSWANFSGVYRPASGKSYLVSLPGPATSTPGAINNFSQSLGSGNAINTQFTGTLANRPVVPGSVSVTDGTEQFTDNGSGGLSGNQGGSGNVNYQTGAIEAAFNFAPVVGQNIRCDYQAYVPGSDENQQPGSSVPIYSLTVNQLGNNLTITDSAGAVYTGKMGSVQTTGGGGGGTISGEVIAQYQVEGNNSMGRPVTITGSFDGIFVAKADQSSGGAQTVTVNPKAGILQNRTIQGTWIEPNFVGDVQGAAAGGVSTTNAPVFTPGTTPIGGAGTM